MRRLEDDVEHALAKGAFDPSKLPELPDLGTSPAAGPRGAQTGARPMHSETDVWSAKVPADLRHARLA